MPVFRIQTPDGRTVRIEADSQDAALAGAQEWSKANPSAAARDAKRRVANTPNQLRAITKGATLSGADEIDAAGAFLETGIGNIGRRLTGKQPEYTARQAYDAVLQANKEADEAYQAERPVQSAGLTIGGGFLMPGGGAIAKGVMGSGKGVLGATNLTGRTIRGAAGGGALGGLEGFLGGSPGERTEGAKRGVGTGAVIGGAIPVAGAALGKVGGGGKRVVNKALGGKLTNPNIEAGRRLAQALKADGLDEAQIRQIQNEWLRTGVTPQMMNVVGENTRRLFRAAGASGGEANQAAVQNVDQLAADLQGSVIDRTRQLTPDSRTAPQLVEDIATRRGNLASQQYAPAYQTPVTVTPTPNDPLMGAPGRAALMRARKAAEARRDFPQMRQLDELLSSMEDAARIHPLSPTNIPTVSAGALDRAKIAMGNAGRGALEDPRTRDIAGGMFSRADDIDALLAQVPELQPARQTFKGMLGQEKAVELGGNNPFSDPQAYGDELQRLMAMETPQGNPFPVSQDQIREAAGVGLRDEIIRNVGAPTEGATGYLNRLGTGTNPGRVLAETFPGQSDDYRGAVQNLVQQLNDARFVSPNSGSQTAMRLEDTGLIDKLPPTSLPGLALRALDKLQKGLTMTEQERAALVQLGKSTNIDASLQAIPQARDPLSQRLIAPAIAGSNQ